MALCRFSSLPAELTVMVVTQLDARSLHRFAATSRAHREWAIADALRRGTEFGPIRCWLDAIRLLLIHTEKRVSSSYIGVVPEVGLQSLVDVLYMVDVNGLLLRAEPREPAEPVDVPASGHQPRPPLPPTDVQEARAIERMRSVPLRNLVTHPDSPYLSSLSDPFCADGSQVQLCNGREVCGPREERFPRNHKLSIGGMHGALIDADGRLHTWARNDQIGVGSFHHLGLGREGDPFFLAPAELHKEIVDVATGFRTRNTLALDIDGVVYSFGSCKGSSHVLGHGNAEDVLQPKRVEALSRVPCAAVATSGTMSLVIARDGKLYGWGHLAQGQQSALPVDTGLRDVVFLSISGNVAVVVTGDGLVRWWNPTGKPTIVESFRGIHAIAAWNGGGNLTQYFAQATDGRVYGCDAEGVWVVKHTTGEDVRVLPHRSVRG